MMESSIPANIKMESLLGALKLDGASLLVLNAEKRITWASDTALELFDCADGGKLVGKKWNELIQIDGVSVWDPSLDEQFQSDGVLKIDGYCDAGTRGRIAIDLSMFPSGRRDGIVVIIRDITDAKSREEELEHEKQNAEMLNTALEREIEKANELAVMAERANIAKSVFLTSMSHEFRTPLNGVLGYAQILSFDEALSDENRKAAATIERCGQHLLSIINDVLDLSKIEAGKVEVSQDPVNIKTLINDVIDVFKVRASSKGLNLVCEYDTKEIELEWIVGDAKLIRQVLINLIGNAVKFTDHGSVTLRIEAKKSKDEDIFRTALRMSVVDTGPGIEKKALQQVFEEFYQTEAFSGHKGGTGLGLAISRKLAVAMGGDLKVESKLGKGSSFHFELPTRRLVQMQEDEKIDENLQNLKFAGSNIAYLQLFHEELDSGVLAGLMRSLGMLDESCYRVKQAIVDVNPELHEHWLVGVSAGGLLADNASALIEWEKHVKGKMVVLLYVDRSQSKCQNLMESLKLMNSPMIPVEIPINVVSVREQLVHQCDYFFSSSESMAPGSESDELPAKGFTGALSKQIPESNVISQLLKEAQMGDMRRFMLKLEEWKATTEQKTEFEVHSRQLVESFKIDQLCKFLEDMLYSAEHESED